MTLDECYDHIGHGVTYICHADGIPEDGTITSTNSVFAFVRFYGDAGSKACRPADLTLAARGLS